MKLLFILFLATSFISAQAKESDDSKKYVTTSYIAGDAKREIFDLIRSRKIESSWLDVKPSSIEKIKVNNHIEWLITFNNPQIKDVSKQKIYLFMNIYGDVILINYDGKR